MPNRSKKFVIVPACLLAQAYQAQGLVKYEWRSCIKPFLQLLVENDINIIQMPCAETEYSGLIRKPAGDKFYSSREFVQLCDKLSSQVEKQVKDIVGAGFQVVAILGIENSPSCAVNYVYSNRGMQKKQGEFICQLYKKLEDTHIPFIGINRRFVNKSLKKLQGILEI